MATVSDLTRLRDKLAGLRNSVLDRLCAELDSGELDLLCAVAASLIACDERLDELRQPGDPVGNANPRLSAPDPSDAHAEQTTCKWLGEAIVNGRDGEHAPDSGHSRDRDVTAGFDPFSVIQRLQRVWLFLPQS